MARLVDAMQAHPDLVAGEGRACTELTRAAAGKIVVKTGVALKIDDGATRASEAAIAAILVELRAIAAEHPAVRRRLVAPIRNRAGREVGRVRAAPEFP